MEINNNDFYKHVDSHPSKILDWLYLGSYNNELNKKVKYNKYCKGNDKFKY